MGKLPWVVLVLGLVLSGCGGSGDGDQTTGQGADGGEVEDPATTAAAGERDFLTFDGVNLIRVNPDDGSITVLGGVGGGATEITQGGGSVWVGRPDGSVVRMSTTGSIEAEIETEIAETVSAIAYDDDGLWVLHGISGVGNSVSMIDPAGDLVRHTATGVEGGYILDLAAGEGGGWGIGSDTETVTALFRFDPATGEREDFDAGVIGNDVATGGGYVWIAGTGFDADLNPVGGVGRFDPVTTESTFIVVGNDPAAVLYAHDSLWVSDPLGGDAATVYRLDAMTGDVIAEFDLGAPFALNMPLFSGAGFVWVHRADSEGRIVVIDPGSNSIAGEGESPAGYPLLFP